MLHLFIESVEVIPHNILWGEPQTSTSRIEAETKWPLLDKYFGIHFLIWKLLWFRCHWNFFPSLQLTITNIGSYNRLVSNRRQAIIWTSDGHVYWCTHASPSLNELTVTKPRFFVLTVGFQVIYCDIAVITVCNNKRRGMICNRHHTTFSISNRFYRVFTVRI